METSTDQTFWQYRRISAAIDGRKKIWIQGFIGKAGKINGCQYSIVAAKPALVLMLLYDKWLAPSQHWVKHALINQF